ncbi:hypothetical protein Dimus_033915 [Dionaea muscipula]
MEPFLQAILGALGAFIFVSIFFLFVFLFYHHRRRRGGGLPNHPVHPPSSSICPSNRTISSVSTDESASFDPSIRHVSMAELQRATNNFDPECVIGDGSFGLVYKAKLASSSTSSSSGVPVALKKLDPNAFQGQREFRAEMETLGRLHHRNLVRILGYCVSGPDRVLIYEFIKRGSLDQWLHETTSSEGSYSSSPLDWDTRVKIIKGVANGLAFLHGLETPIVHRDIKASNVLLDGDFEAHIADFGLARWINGSHSHVSTQVAGTMGYMPPEYRAGMSAATVKADAYSFGVLMFEVASGRRPNWPFKEEEEEEKEGGEWKELRLVEWAKKKIAAGKATQILDKNLPGREEVLARDRAAVGEFARIADLCTREKPKERPAMSHVVELLDALSNGESESIVQLNC